MRIVLTTNVVFFGCCKNAKVSFHFTGSFGEELPDNGRREELDDVEDDRLPPTLKTSISLGH
jgi:hypothetical protein